MERKWNGDLLIHSSMTAAPEDSFSGLPHNTPYEPNTLTTRHDTQPISNDTYITQHTKLINVDLSRSHSHSIFTISNSH